MAENSFSGSLCHETHFTPSPQRHAGYAPGADVGQYDRLPCLLGSAALLTIPLRPLLSRIPPRPGLALSFALFLVLRDVNKGFLGLAGVPLLYLPRNWYANTLSAGLGFPAPSFVSSDYFPLLPWLFLFWTGFYLYRLRPETPAVPDIRLPGIGAIGRHSLMVYLLHQPVIYGLLALIFSLQEVHLCLS